MTKQKKSKRFDKQKESAKIKNIERKGCQIRPKNQGQKNIRQNCKR